MGETAPPNLWSGRTITRDPFRKKWYLKEAPPAEQLAPSTSHITQHLSVVSSARSQAWSESVSSFWTQYTSFHVRHICSIRCPYVTDTLYPTNTISRHLVLCVCVSSVVSSYSQFELTVAKISLLVEQEVIKPSLRTFPAISLSLGKYSSTALFLTAQDWSSKVRSTSCVALCIPCLVVHVCSYESHQIRSLYVHGLCVYYS